MLILVQPQSSLTVGHDDLCRSLPTRTTLFHNPFMMCTITWTTTSEQAAVLKISEQRKQRSELFMRKPSISLKII